MRNWQAYALSGIAFLVSTSCSPKAKQDCACVSQVKNIYSTIKAFEISKSQPLQQVYVGDGVPMYNWRVKILPYCDFGSSSKDYDFESRWDSKTNMSKINDYSSFYYCELNKKSRIVFVEDLNIKTTKGIICLIEINEESYWSEPIYYKNINDIIESLKSLDSFCVVYSDGSLLSYDSLSDFKSTIKN